MEDISLKEYKKATNEFFQKKMFHFAILVAAVSLVFILA